MALEGLVAIDLDCEVALEGLFAIELDYEAALGGRFAIEVDWEVALGGLFAIEVNCEVAFRGHIAPLGMSLASPPRPQPPEAALNLRTAKRARDSKYRGISTHSRYVPSYLNRPRSSAKVKLSSQASMSP